MVFLWVGQNSETTISEPSPAPLVEEAEATGSATYGVEGEKVRVVEVVDGDTLKTDAGKTVRLIGIDTPETKDPR